MVKIVTTGQFTQVSGLLTPVVPARIQHGLPEGNDGFRPAVHVPRRRYICSYIFTLTCHYPVGQGTRPRCRRLADGRTRAGAPRKAGTRRLPPREPRAAPPH